jgi:hypothetical protein
VGWHTVNFSNLPQNEITVTAKGMKTKVASSSSALVYPFAKPLLISKIAFEGSTEGYPTLNSETAEAEIKADDYVLRLGLIEKGEISPTFFERLFAPHWLKELRSFWKEDSFQRLILLKVAQNEPKGSVRKHPSSKFIEEEVVKSGHRPQDLAFTHEFIPPISSLGLWLQSDGDGTHSEFIVEGKKLEIWTQDN